MLGGLPQDPQCSCIRIYFVAAPSGSQMFCLALAQHKAWPQRQRLSFNLQEVIEALAEVWDQEEFYS